MKGHLLGLSLLTASVLVSAFAVIYSKHRTRVLFSELQELEAIRDRKATEWGQLQLEESTWATHGRIESVARKQLKMVLPTPETMVLVRP